MLNREKTMPGVRLGKSALNRQSTESQLIKQAVDDPVQFGVLYRQHVSKVYRYIYARVSSQALKLLPGAKLGSRCKTTMNT